jgi:hypothetical protein
MILFSRSILLFSSLSSNPISFPQSPLARPLLTLAGRWVAFAEQMRMEVPKDLGRRIVEAARLAVALHLQRSLGLEPQLGTADSERLAPMDGGASAPRSADSLAGIFHDGDAQ